MQIADGRPRTVSFTTDVNGLVLGRDENDNNTSLGDPRELHYYFDGIAIGDVTNNGPSNIDYALSIAEHTQVPGTGPFQGGANNGLAAADFDQSYDPINGLNYQSTATSYTVAAGDTLQGIAQAVYGDSSFWYLIADANGMGSSNDLVAGQTIQIPNKIANSHNTADTF